MHQHAYCRETKAGLNVAAMPPQAHTIKPVRFVGGFFIRLLFWYVLMTLLVTWSPVLKNGYAAFFRAYASSVFSSFHGIVRTTWLPAIGQDAYDTVVKLRNVRAPANIEGDLHCDSRRMGYAPLSVIVALVLATPLPWRRRVTALLWSVIAVHLFIALRVELTLLNAFCYDSPARLYTLSPFWSSVLEQAHSVIACNFQSSIIGPTLLWVLVTFRRGDWDRWCVQRAALVNSGETLSQSQIHSRCSRS